VGEALGLIAGKGRLPLEIARAAARAGREVHAIALRGLADPALAEIVHSHRELAAGRLEAAIETLQERRASEAVLAGKVPKALLLLDPAALEIDPTMARVLAGLDDQGDDSILGAIADTLEGRGIHLLEQAALVPELVPGPGPLGRVELDAKLWADLRFAWPIAKAIAGHDVGQVVVVKERAVLAVEAIEGTDRAIARAGELGGAGASVVKVAKPHQDPRFDLPAIGLETLEALEAAGARLLAFEAGATLVLDRDELVRRADRSGIGLLAVPSAGPGGLR
jgi:DUF1009 family protein